MTAKDRALLTIQALLEGGAKHGAPAIARHYLKEKITEIQATDQPELLLSSKNLAIFCQWTDHEFCKEHGHAA